MIEPGHRARRCDARGASEQWNFLVGRADGSRYELRLLDLGREVAPQRSVWGVHNRWAYPGERPLTSGRRGCCRRRGPCSAVAPPHASLAASITQLSRANGISVDTEMDVVRRTHDSGLPNSSLRAAFASSGGVESISHLSQQSESRLTCPARVADGLYFFQWP